MESERDDDAMVDDDAKSERARERERGGLLTDAV
jgi:hypothetical protein